MKSKTLTRKELYDLVWSKSVNQIAKQNNVADSDIRKICKQHNIPLPKSGYWSKIRHHKNVIKTKLQDQKDNPTICLEITNKVLNKGNQILSEIGFIKNKIKAENKINFEVPKKLKNPHKFIVATKLYNDKIIDKRKKRDWSIEIDNTNSLSINVSDNLFSRALRFMDTLIKILEFRGFEVFASGNMKIVLREQSYNLRLIEKSKRVKIETNYSWDQYDLVPIGKLVLKLDSSYPIKEWSGSKTIPIEKKLINIISWLELRVDKDEKQALENAIWRKQQDEKLKKEKYIKDLEEKELSKFSDLFHTATRWHKTQYLRNYINEFEKHFSEIKQLSTEKKDWIKWAREKADWYDPFIEKEIELLKNIDRDSL